jgi:carboxylesterase type B
LDLLDLHREKLVIQSLFSNGFRLVYRYIVVVSIAYRLGPFGFFRHEVEL